MRISEALLGHPLANNATYPLYAISNLIIIDDVACCNDAAVTKTGKKTDESEVFFKPSPHCGNDYPTDDTIILKLG